MPSNSSERSQTGSWTLKVTDFVASALAALSVERYSTRCVPLLETVTVFTNGLSEALLVSVFQSPAMPLVVMRYSVFSTPAALVPVSVAERLTLTRAVVRVAGRRSGRVERRRRGRRVGLAGQRVRGDPEVVDVDRAGRAGVGVARRWCPGSSTR